MPTSRNARRIVVIEQSERLSRIDVRPSIGSEKVVVM
jgi:hypothetical protein